MNRGDAELFLLAMFFLFGFILGIYMYVEQERDDE